jgi:hypothetical protein
MENKRIFGRIAAAFPLVRYLRYRPEADPGFSSPGKCRQDCLQQTPNVAPVAGQTAALAELRDSAPAVATEKIKRILAERAVVPVPPTFSVTRR